ncbi:MAG: hypothetical protein L0332_02290 [Chloroflexi bacterium]|nr:hypothetical protein [Chloroflexota bacterium]MCI0577530.1 hypothetical protein [Chloroflexota bacterium]MCI0645631.1 hypothetical protein [Chloroflexota bacterium]MCI0725543.1 hypothetical protein [Chloroflexota bacterium]
MQRSQSPITDYLITNYSITNPKRHSAVPYIRPAAFFILGLGLAACSAVSRPAGQPQSGNQGGVEVIASGQVDVPPTPTLAVEELPDLGPAPEISNDLWLNTDGPLPLAALRGKVVLVEFWTFG